MTNTNTTEPAKAVSSTDLLGFPRPNPAQRALAWDWLKRYALKTKSGPATAALLEWEYQRRNAEKLHDNCNELNRMIDDLRAENARLRDWKESAMYILNKWEAVWEAAGRPGMLGSSKAEAVLKYIQPNAI